MIDVLVCLLIGMLFLLMGFVFWVFNRSRTSIEQAAEQSGYLEADIHKLIRDGLLGSQRRYLLWGLSTVEVERIAEAAAAHQEIERIRAEMNAYVRQRLEEYEVHERLQQEELNQMRRVHAEVLKHFQLKVLPQRVRHALQVLGVPDDASFDVIRQRYRTLAKQAHPDTGGDHTQFLRLQDAYACVMTWIEQQASKLQGENDG